MTHQIATLLAEYNRWMNQRLYDAASTLPELELTRDRGAFFGSILQTLNHIAAADLIWKAHRPAVIVCDMHFSLGENGDRWLRTIPKPVGKMLVSGTVTHNTLTLAAEMSGALARIKPPDEVVEDVRQLLALALASSSL